MDETKSLPENDGTKQPNEGSDDFSVGDVKKIGRYKILGILGKGGFGRVYLAHDDDLNRPVAIKVPRPDRVSQPKDIEAYLNEARILASLDHPHIVPVYDVGRTEDGLCFVVSKLIEGSDLAKRIRESRPGFQDSAGLVATVSEALHYAHTRGVVHRDVKPANILIDASGKAFVADFGLALKDEDFGKVGGLAGTPSYMSPEQARGEVHRVDGRSDVFSLGVVFYELLTGRRPFIAKAEDKDEACRELLDLITTAEARPPRQIDDTIPKELERICLKAMTKRASDRYTTGRDMAEDLREFLKNSGGTVLPTGLSVAIATLPGSTQEVTPVPSTSKQSDSDQQPVRIVPKGLRSFDEQDADFFLELLPGPRDRLGLPESLRFWKSRIETSNADKTFRVGLIYGPSGCGKSSLVKAGLLPRLVKYVLTVYVEATPEETESRLLRALRKACPDLSSQLSLVDCLMVIRQGRVLRSGQKVLLVLDQFEQWLHAKRGEENTELVAALRQCDGEHVQAVVMVRDDFWLAASRFMRDLEIDLEPNLNIALVDLFDPQHAQKVLGAFGTAYGKLPERERDRTKDQHAFLDQAISGLAQDGKVISVRLAVFAEMAKGKPWTPATLRAVGGTEGVGFTFLEETFSSPQANPKYRLHQKAAQAVLKALLPETGRDIKGQMRSESDLRDSSGYADRPRDFADLMHVLDNELRLITPTDPEGSEDDQATAAPGGRFYQLTHDYLVHSLRDWLTRKQRETRRGRTELRLAERSSLWNAKPENRHLPSTLEWANIRLLTRKKDWNEPQRKMMKRASRVHGVRGLTLATMLILLVWGGYRVYEQQEKMLRDSLLGIVHDEKRPEYERARAASALAASGDPPVELTELLIDGPEWQFAELYGSVARWSDRTTPLLEIELAKKPPSQPSASDNEARAKYYEDSQALEKYYERQAKAAMALIRMGRTEKPWTLLKHSADPSQRSRLVHELKLLSVEPGVIISRIGQESDVSIRRALILSLGEYREDMFSTSLWNDWTKELLNLYRNDPDPGIHGAADWLLRKWRNEDQIKVIDKELEKLTLHTLSVDQGATSSQENNRGWYVNSQGQTMVIVRGPVEFDMWEEAGRHRERISHHFAISSKEVTVDQFQRFLKENPRIQVKNNERYSPEPTCPMNSVSWYDAAAYCNWLSKQERLPEDQWCYAPNEKGDYAEGMKLMSNTDKRTGYRLPTEAEWEFSCRAGSVTRYSFGEPWELLKEYGWYSKNSPNRTQTVGRLKPNDLGLFDLHGNVFEWCQDRYMEPEKGKNSNKIIMAAAIADKDQRILRGGAFNDPSSSVCSSSRPWGVPSLRLMNGGFRPARTCPE